MKVGFLGLGNMGSAMARNLIRAGHSLTVFNRTPTRAEEFRALGAKIACSPAEAALGVEAFITMLADDGALESVVFEPGKAIEALPPDSVHLSMSTISVALSRRLAEAHRSRRQNYIGAPVFGRPEAAAARKLFVVAAGPSRQIERCQPIFEAIGQRTFMMGEDAAVAHLIKLAGNFMITTVIESLAEAFALVRKHGVDPGKFLEVLTESLFRAPVYRTYGPIVAANKFDQVGFSMPLGFKDNRLVLAAAEEAYVPMPLATLVHDRFVAAMAQGLKDSDWAAIARIAYRSAGLDEG